MSLRPAPSPLISGSKKKNRNCAVASSTCVIAIHPDGTPLSSRIYMQSLLLSNWLTKLRTPSVKYAFHISDVKPYSRSYNASWRDMTKSISFSMKGRIVIFDVATAVCSFVIFMTSDIRSYHFPTKITLQITLLLSICRVNDTRNSNWPSC